MKVGMTAILPAAGFNDEHTCMRKVITPIATRYPQTTARSGRHR